MSGSKSFRCFGFLLFSHFSLAKFWAGGDSVGYPLVIADAWKMLVLGEGRQRDIAAAAPRGQTPQLHVSAAFVRNILFL